MNPDLESVGPSHFRTISLLETSTFCEPDSATLRLESLDSPRKHVTCGNSPARKLNCT
jgi:hypothetical protein